LQHEQAESFFSRALTIMENAYGPNHPDVAKCMANLASSYMNQQKFDLAEPLLVQSLQTLTKSLGPYDPAVASVLTRIATLYRKTGRNEAAEEIGARVESFMEFAYETKVSIDL
jgi:hypothetical protein